MDTHDSILQAQSLLKSDKIRDRQAGLVAYTDILAHHSAVLDEYASTDGLLSILQAIFTCVAAEKALWIKKPHDRLSHVASVLRKYTEKLVQQMNRRVIKSLINHLLDLIEYRHQPFEPIILDYSKCIRTVLEVSFHLENLDVQTWNVATAMSLAILLRSNLRLARDGLSVEMLQSLQSTSDEDNPRPGKRRKISFERYHQTSYDHDFASCAVLLIKSQWAPLLGSIEDEDYHYYEILLRIYTLLLPRMGGDPNLLFEIYQGLNSVLQEVLLNDQNFLRRIASDLWNCTINFFRTKNRSVREQMLIAMHSLRHLICDEPILVNTSWQILLREQSARSSLEPLLLSSIRFSREAHSIYSSRHFTQGLDFTSDDAVTWSTLELTAFLLNCSLKSHDASSFHTRQDHPITQLIQLCSSSISVEQIWALQILSFYLGSFGSSLPTQCKKSVAAHVQSLMLFNDSEDVHNWAIVALSHIIASDDSWQDSNDRAKIWQSLIRTILNVATSRASAFLCLLFLDYGALDSRKLLDDLSHLIHQLSLLNQDFLTDAFCALLERFITVANSNLKHSRSHHDKSTLAWLYQIWTGSVSPSSSSFFPFAFCQVEDALRLVTRIAHLAPEIPRKNSMHLFEPECDLTTYLRMRQNHQSLETFTMEPEDFERKIDNCVELTGKVTARFGTNNEAQISLSSIKTLCSMLKSKLQTLDNVLAPSQLPHERVSYGQLVNGTKLINLTIVFQAVVHRAGFERDSQMLTLASKLLVFTLQKMELQQHSCQEKLLMMSFLQPIFQSEVLSAPSPPLMRTKFNDTLRSEDENICSQIWSFTEMASCAHELRKIFMQNFSPAWSRNGSLHETPNEEFEVEQIIMTQVTGSAMLSNSRSMDRTKQRENNLVSAFRLVTIYASLYAELSFHMNNDSNPVLHSPLLQLSHVEDGALFLSLASSPFAAISQKMILPNLEEAEQIIDSMTDWISTYSFKKSTAMLCLAMECLKCLLPFWQGVDTSLAITAQDLFVYFSKNFEENKIQSRRVKISFNRLLQDLLTYKCSLEERAFTLEDSDQSLIFWNLINHSLLDIDSRVRFDALDLIQNRDILQANRKRIPQLISDLTTIGDSQSRHLTKILCLRYLAEFVPSARSDMINHMIEMTFRCEKYDAHVRSAFSILAVSVGFEKSSDLFLQYVPDFSISALGFGSHIASTKHAVFGFVNRLDFYKGLLAGLGSSLLIHGKCEAFETLSHLAGQSLQDSYCRCFAQRIGTTRALIEQNLIESPGLERDDMTAQVQEIFTEAVWKCCNQERDVNSALLSYGTEICINILSIIWDSNLSDSGAYFKALGEAKNATSSRQIFKRLMGSARSFTGFMTFPPLRPIASPQTAPASMESIFNIDGEQIDEQTCFAIINGLFERLDSQKIPNERHRLTSSLIFFISYADEIVANSFQIAGAIIRWTSLLITDLSLAEICYRLSELAIEIVLKKAELPSGFEQSILQLATVTCSRLDLDSESCSLNEALENMENKLTELSAYVTDEILLIQILWPRDSFDLSSLTLEELTTFLKDSRFTTISRFSMALPIWKSIESQQHKVSSAVCGDISWHLWDSLRSHKHTATPAEQTAFINILKSASGNVKQHNEFDQYCQGSPYIHFTDLKVPKNKFNLFVLDGRLIKGCLMICLLKASTKPTSAIHSSIRNALWCDPELLHSVKWPAGILSELSMYQAKHNFKFQTTQELEVQQTCDRSWSDQKTCHSAWLMNLLKSLSAFMTPMTPLYKHLWQALSVDINLAEAALPYYILHCLIDIHEEQNAKGFISDNFNRVLKQSKLNSQSIRLISEVVIFLRGCAKSASDPDQLDVWLNVDYIGLSQALARYGANTSSYMLLEMLGGQTNEVGEEFFYDVCSKLDDVDTFYGVSSSNTRYALLKKFHHEVDWRKAYALHGAIFEAQRSNRPTDDWLAYSLQAQGLNKLALTILPHETNTSESLSFLTSELGWRTNAWDLPCHVQEPDSNLNHSISLYRALKAVRTYQNVKQVDCVLSSCFKLELENLQIIDAENFDGLRTIVGNLLCLDIVNMQTNKVMEGSQRDVEILQPQDIEFSAYERLVSTELSLLESRKAKECHENIGQILSPIFSDLVRREKSLYLSRCVKARDQGLLQNALNDICKVQALDAQLDPSSVGDAQTSSEFARVLWDMGEHDAAIKTLQETIKLSSFSSCLDVSIQAEIFAKLGNWSAIARQQRPEVIETEFFMPAYQMMQANSKNSGDGTVYHLYATFAEDQYERLVQSSEVKRLRYFVDRKKEEIKQLEILCTTQRTGAQKKHLEAAVKQLGADEVQLSRLLKSKSAFLISAVTMHANTLKFSGDHDQTIIPLCSMWLANFQDDQFNSKISPVLLKIPLSKYLLISHQLLARASKEPSRLAVFDSILENLIAKICITHPYHTYQQVYALCRTIDARETQERADISRRQTNKTRNRSTYTSTSTSRENTVTKLANRLKAESRLSALINEMDDAFTIFTEWAELHPDQCTSVDANQSNQSTIQMVPDNVRLKNFTHRKVPVTTFQIPVDASLHDSRIVYIRSYSKVFKFAGGLHRPKIIDCVGTDGKKYKQLFKREDDVRQDAAMEQIFGLANDMLYRDKEARKRSLCVRTYCIIALGPQVGILEFVGNTTTLGAWLTDAHQNYNPKDPKPNAIRNKLASVVKSDAAIRIKTYNNCCKSCKPVMRHFFTESHKNPRAWFAMRLCYSRSVATNSIVGYILGIGDRHVSNILITNDTGEVVHIDFGFAFDQGKLLPIPELVPFRLTRDMVDGLGTSGVEGVFRKCAEETLRITRTGSHVFKTVLEVFKYDPLHSWTLNPVKAFKQSSATRSSQLVSESPTANPETSDTASEAAERAILSVVRKLDSDLSVQYTINDLIQSAVDPNNLGLIFHGWSPCF